MSAKLSVEQSLMKAKSHVKKGDLAEAQKLYETILQNISNNIRAQQGIGVLNKPIKNNVIQNPPQEAFSQLVNLYNQGQMEAVIEQAEALTAQYPGAYIIWNMLGASRAQTGMLDEALEALNNSISLKPDYADAYYNKGYALYYLDKLDKAIEAYSKSISLKPDYAEAYSNMGVALKNQGKFDEAIEAIKKSIALKPNDAEAYSNLGVAFKDQGKLDEAIEAHKKSILLKPSRVEAYNNLGNTLKEQGRLDQALETYNKAISLKPDYADACCNISFIYNLFGDFKKGLELYEWRQKQKNSPVRAPRKNLIWDGVKPLSGKKFLVYEEQGLGDAIQFCRYLPLLKKKGAEVTFKVKKKMHALLSTIDNDIVLVDSFPDNDQIDFEAPIMSLPFLFNTNLDTIPAKIPYLFTNDNNILSWAKCLTKSTFKVGICWQGSKNKIDYGRSFSLSLFEGISKIPNVELISLHKGEGEKQIKEINFDLTILDNNFDSGENAFVDTAAVMMNCDLIVTSDTAIAHLAGTLGCPTWVVLKKVPDWRWMLKRKDSPWYPNITLYRQKQIDNWTHVFDKIQMDLQSLIIEKGIQ